jgi:UDP-N-acetylmuramoyl-tripeptide--D-alanyl-D-alanine ligase
VRGCHADRDAQRRVAWAASPARWAGVEHPIGGLVVVNDCYNANPMSMSAALDDLAAPEVIPPTHRVAVLGGRGSAA